MFTGIIYKTTNNITGKIYVGQDLHNKSAYLGSGKILWLSICKHGKEHFSKEILEYCISREHMHEREKFWINELDARNPIVGYNISAGGGFGDTMSTHPDKDQIYEKIVENKRTKYIDSNGNNSYDIAAKHRKNTLLANIDENGHNGYTQIALKTMKTMKTSIDANGLSIFDKFVASSIQTKHDKAKKLYPELFSSIIKHTILDSHTNTIDSEREYQLYYSDQSNFSRKLALLSKLIASDNKQIEYRKKQKLITIILIKS